MITLTQLSSLRLENHKLLSTVIGAKVVFSFNTYLLEFPSALFASVFIQLFLISITRPGILQFSELSSMLPHFALKAFYVRRTFGGVLLLSHSNGVSHYRV